jgi:hypothetical protein
VGIVDPTNRVLESSKEEKVLFLVRQQTVPLIMAWPIAIGFQIAFLVFVQVYNKKQDSLLLAEFLNLSDMDKLREQSETEKEDTNNAD